MAQALTWNSFSTSIFHLENLPKSRGLLLQSHHFILPYLISSTARTPNPRFRVQVLLYLISSHPQPLGTKHPHKQKLKFRKSRNASYFIKNRQVQPQVSSSFFTFPLSARFVGNHRQRERIKRLQAVDAHAVEGLHFLLVELDVPPPLTSLDLLSSSLFCFHLLGYTGLQLTMRGKLMRLGKVPF